MLPFYIALTPLLIGLLSPIWFPMTPPVRRIRKGAKWLDPQPVQIPVPNPLTIRILRDYDKCGDRLVVAHHLAEWTKDLQRKIFTTLVFNAAATFVLVIVFAVRSNPTLQGTTATWHDLVQAIMGNWPFSLLIAWSLLETLVFVKLISDLAAKYSKIIDAAKPPREPNRFSKIFGFS